LALAEIDRFKSQLKRMRKTQRPRRRFPSAPWRPVVALIGIAAAGYLIFGGPADRIGGYAEKVVGGQSIGEIVGPAYVVDGDTIKIQGVRIRFYGIDAPESSQQCSDATGTEYSCGQDATAALDNMVRGQTVRCDQRDTDKYGRAVAICTANGTDLNAALVEAGLAVAYRHFSLIYVGNEESARQAHRGLWAGSSEMPWDYRRSGR
jgi:endonuclease YncB( thermonuclease family)